MKNPDDKDLPKAAGPQGLCPSPPGSPDAIDFKWAFGSLLFSLGHPALTCSPPALGPSSIRAAAASEAQDPGLIFFGTKGTKAKLHCVARLTQF